MDMILPKITEVDGDITLYPQEELLTAKLLTFALARADFLMETDMETTILSVFGPVRSHFGKTSDQLAGQALSALLRSGHGSDCAELSVAARTGRRWSERVMTLSSGRIASWAANFSPALPGRIYLSVSLIERRQRQR
jgi:hypothetical protein